MLFLSAEVAPFSKTGGLGDVAGALPRALAAQGCEVLVVTPLYRQVSRAALLETDLDIAVEFPASRARFRVFEHRAADGVTILFLSNEALFGRAGLYDEGGHAYSDNAERFAAFSIAALKASLLWGFAPHVVHLNDWHTALAAVALKQRFVDTALAAALCVFTVHNAAFAGNFPRQTVSALGLSWQDFSPSGFEFYGELSFLKAGFSCADVVTTVSPTHARELLTPEGGFGFDGFLRARGGVLGILNGIDTSLWDPSTDAGLPAKFSATDLSGKHACARALLERLGLSQANVERRAPIFGSVGRLAAQKGVDLLIQEIPHLVAQGARVIVVGEGEERFVSDLLALERAHPKQVAVRAQFDEGLSHALVAGADFFLMPSRYEPCGLTQMHASRYGTVPVVRRVGGLADSVVDLSQPEGTGIVFDDYSSKAFAEATERALKLFGDSAQLLKVRRSGMRRDFSWARAASQYVALYREAKSAR